MKAQKTILIVFILMCVSYVFFPNGAQACWTRPGYQNPCGWQCCEDINCCGQCAFNFYCLIAPWDPDCQSPTGEPCPSCFALNNDKTKLDVLSEMRDDRIVRTAFGRSLVKLYYKHSREITSILLADEELFSFVAPVLNEIAEKAVGLNRDEKVSIDREQIENILQAADLINEKASPELKAAITRVRQQIVSGYIFRNFGITVND